MQTKNNAKIAIVGKFTNLHDEEYIARSFEMLGCEVFRIPQHLNDFDIAQELAKNKPDILLYSKWTPQDKTWREILKQKREGLKTVCWLFDLYFGYPREYQVRNASFFRSDYVFTTDGGHQVDFFNAGIKHICIRQGIYKEECVRKRIKKAKYEVVFVGSENPLYMERNNILYKLAFDFNFKWFGRKNTNEKRGMDLNDLYAETKIVVGDSVYSPYYWSNRVVETLGRGGFLIHRDVPGLKDEYPDIVTYDGTYEDLKKKIRYYLDNEMERREIIQKNFELVKKKYTMDKRCKELLAYTNYEWVS